MKTHRLGFALFLISWVVFCGMGLNAGMSWGEESRGIQITGNSSIVFGLVGNAKVFSEKKEKRDLDFGDNLDSGDVIQTAPDSGAEVLLKQSAVLAIQGGSEVAFAEGDRLELRDGVVELGVASSRLNQDDIIEIQMPSGILQTHDGVVLIHSENKGRVHTGERGVAVTKAEASTIERIYVREGTVRFIPQHANAIPLTLKAGQNIRIRGGILGQPETSLGVTPLGSRIPKATAAIAEHGELGESGKKFFMEKQLAQVAPLVDAVLNPSTKEEQDDQEDSLPGNDQQDQDQGEPDKDSQEVAENDPAPENNKPPKPDSNGKKPGKRVDKNSPERIPECTPFCGRAPESGTGTGGPVEKPTDEALARLRGQAIPSGQQGLRASPNTQPSSPQTPLTERIGHGNTRFEQFEAAKGALGQNILDTTQSASTKPFLNEQVGQTFIRSQQLEMVTSAFGQNTLSPVQSLSGVAAYVGVVQIPKVTELPSTLISGNVRVSQDTSFVGNNFKKDFLSTIPTFNKLNVQEGLTP